MTSILGNKFALAGLATAAAIVGYCIYFDQKRRSAPNFKKNLAEKRRQQKLQEQEEIDRKARAQLGGAPSAEVLKDPRALKQYFVNTMAAGQEAMQSGDTETAATHFVNALRVYQEPAALLQVLKQTVPPDVFVKVVQKLQTMKESAPQ